MIGLFIAGCITFPLIHYVISTRSLPKVLPGRTKELYVAISTRIVSMLQALCATCIGLHVTLSCKDIMKERFISVNYYAWFAVSYFYYDVGAMFLEIYHAHSSEMFLSICQKFISKKCLLVLHHIFLPLFGFPIVVFFRHGIGDFFVGCIYMAEMSTPFLSVHAIMGRLEWQKNIFYKINGFLLVVSFFFGRVLLFPFMYWSYAKHTKQSVWNIPFKIPLLCNLSCLGLLLLQLVWFLAILKRISRHLRRTKLDFDKSTDSIHYTNNGTVYSNRVPNGMSLKLLMESSRIANGKQKL